MVLNKKALMKALALKRDTAELAEGEVLVSELEATEYMEVCNMSAVGEPDKDGNLTLDMRKYNALLFARACIDEKGARLFTDEESVGFSKSYKPFMKVVAKIKELNGLTSVVGNASEPTKGGSTTGE